MDHVVACPSTGDAGRRRRGELGHEHVPWAADREPGRSIAVEALTLQRIVRAHNPDIVHLHSSKAGLVGRLAIRGRVPTVFQPHAWSFSAVRGITRSASLSWERAAQRWTHATICVSEDERARGHRARVLGAGGRRRDGHVLANALDVGAWPVLDRPLARARLGIPADTPTAVCVGRLCRQEDESMLMAAWPGVTAALGSPRRQGGPLEPLLVFVGDGPDRPYLERTRAPGAAWSAPTIPTCGTPPRTSWSSRRGGRRWRWCHWRRRPARASSWPPTSTGCARACIRSRWWCPRAPRRPDRGIGPRSVGPTPGGGRGGTRSRAQRATLVPARGPSTAPGDLRHGHRAGSRLTREAVTRRHVSGGRRGTAPRTSTPPASSTPAVSRSSRSRCTASTGSSSLTTTSARRRSRAWTSPRMLRSTGCTRTAPGNSGESGPDRSESSAATGSRATASAPAKPAHTRSRVCWATRSGYPTTATPAPTVARVPGCATAPARGRERRSPPSAWRPEVPRAGPRR